VKALRFERSLARFAAARVAGTLAPGRGAKVGPLRLVDVDPPMLPGAGWHVVRPRLAGICGSDLATVDGMSSRYFEPIVSFPFIPGHEVVGELDDGTRVVVEPVLHCAIRGLEPCDWCRAGQTNRCEKIAFGHLEPGLQSGFCEDTGGGWSTSMVAHDAQIHRVPDDFTDEQAVMVEPTACAVHAAAAHPGVGLTVVLGSGTIGLCTIAALRNNPGPQGEIIAVAKHPEQRRLAKHLGADVVCEPGELAGVVRRHSGSLQLGDQQLTGGADHVLDCVGTSDSIQQSLRVVAPGGQIHLVGMPATVTVDLTGLWHREVSITGRYAYTHAEFERAFDVVRDADLGRLVSATYTLDNFTVALQHAAEAGRRGAVKIAFDLRNEKERSR
jgi:threonine dehydrogenase-like Zn-dependent dehydrogenase